MFGRILTLTAAALAVAALAAVAGGCGSVDGDKLGAGTTAAGEGTSAPAAESAPDGGAEGAEGADGGNADGGEEAKPGKEGQGGDGADSGEEGGDGAEAVGGAADGEAEAGAAPEAGASSIPKKQYVEEGDAICENVPNEYQKLIAKLPKKQQENVQVSVPKAAIPPLHAASDAFAELGAPDGDQAKAQEIVDALQTAISILEADPTKALAGPGSAFVKFNKLTKELGFKICSQL